MSSDKTAGSDRRKPKAKKPAKANKKAKKSVVVPMDDDAGAPKRVAVAKARLTEAMKDPLMRDQLVRAIRTMIREGKS